MYKDINIGTSANSRDYTANLSDYPTFLLLLPLFDDAKSVEIFSIAHVEAVVKYLNYIYEIIQAQIQYLKYCKTITRLKMEKSLPPYKISNQSIRSHCLLLQI